MVALMGSRGGLPLYWTVCLTNAAMFVIAAVVLVVSPATVSEQVTVPEITIVVVGVVVIVLANAALLRGQLLPLDRLAGQLDRGDVTDAAWRLPLPVGGGVERSFVTAFNTLLDRLNEERLASESKARAAEEAERRRIARELHDQVGQRLTVVLLSATQLHKVSTPQQRGELDLIRENTRESLDIVRGLAEGLRRGLLEDMDLVGALTSLTATFAASDELQVIRRFDRRATALDPEVQMALFRVAQESLTNAARHAGADTVTVELGQHEDAGQKCVALTVSDNGRGYQAGSAGFGIAGMRERARAVGGTLALSAGQDGGTQVRFVVPVGTGS
jgi:two-component system sensor histidine kinase UhpB